VIFSGAYAISAPRNRVWAALNDHKVLKATIPGCERIEWVAADRLEAEIRLDLGLTALSFGGELTLSDVDPATSYTLCGRGKGGWLGWAKGEARITLADHKNGTSLRFEATTATGQGIARLGKTLIGGRAQSVIDGFFDRFGSAIGATVEPIV
jgi:uncharacterized protein